jgi:D-alanyl-D-alanine dipeptidase
MNKHIDPGAYWVRTLAEGAAFMRAAEAHPIDEQMEPLTDLPAAARAAGVRLAVRERHRTGRIVDARLRTSNVEALLEVADRLERDGLLLVVEDAFRSPSEQASLGRDPRSLETVAALVKRYRLATADHDLVAWMGVMIAATPRTSGHVAAAAVDVSVRLPDGGDLDRGASYPNWSERMPMDSPFISADHAAARAIVSNAMAAHGFVALPYEFWHYSRGDTVAAIATASKVPARHGPVVATDDGQVSPVASLERFNDPQKLLALFHASSERDRRAASKQM